MNLGAFKPSTFGSRNASLFPEVKRSHESGELERAKARRRIERSKLKRQAANQEDDQPRVIEERRDGGAEQKQAANQEAEQTVATREETTPVKPKSTRPGVALDEAIRVALLEHISEVGEREAIIDVENQAPEKRGTASAKAIVRSLRDPHHRWSLPHVNLLKSLLATWKAGKRPHELRRESVDLTLNGEVVTVVGKVERSAPVPEPEVAPKPETEPEPGSEATAMTYLINEAGLPVMTIEGVTVRVAGTPDRPLFCAADVCRALGIVKASQACEVLDQDETDTVPVADTVQASGSKHATFVTEPGLYKLIGKSRKPMAKAFDRWVRHEVLPSIRRTGSYTSGKPGASRADASFATSVALAVTSAMAPMWTAMLESQERQNELFLRVLTVRPEQRTERESITPKPFNALSPGHQASIIRSMVATHAEQLLEEGIPNHYRTAWNAVYDQYRADTGDDVKKRASHESDSTGVRTHPFELLKSEGKLVPLWEAARKLWKKAS